MARQGRQRRCCSRATVEVEVFERAPVLGPVGAGFLLQPTGLAVLWELGLLDAAFLALAERTQNAPGRLVGKNA